MSFADLLRRSRFATFDPHIRQAYGAPPSHIARGNWGLKRPIAAKRKNAFISLNNFEEHAQYIEWSNAEPQVRFIRRMEELNVTPSIVPGTTWHMGLGATAQSNDSQMDSEFCPGEKGLGVDRPVTPHLTEAEELAQEQDNLARVSSDLSGLGQRGEGAYGIHAVPPALDLPAAIRDTSKDKGNNLQPNIFAMSPSQFKRYIEKLRTLRPEFEKFLRANNSSPDAFYPAGSSPSRDKSAINLYNVKDLTKGNSHVAFLGQVTSEHFSTPETEPRAVASKPSTYPEPQRLVPENALRQQPHRYAGLTYHTPTPIESLHTSPPTPAHVLQRRLHDDAHVYLPKSQHRKLGFVVSVGGITADLNRDHASPTVDALLDPILSEGVKDGMSLAGKDVLDQAIEQTTTEVKVYKLELENVPQTVGSHTVPDLLQEVAIQAKVVEKEVWEAASTKATTTPAPSMSAYASPLLSSPAFSSSESFAAYLTAQHTTNQGSAHETLGAQTIRAAMTPSIEPNPHPVGSMEYYAQVPSWYKRQMRGFDTSNGMAGFSSGYVGYQKALGGSSGEGAEGSASRVGAGTKGVMDTLRGLPSGGFGFGVGGASGIGRKVGASLGGKGAGNRLVFGDLRSGKGVGSKGDKTLDVLSKMSSGAAKKQQPKQQQEGEDGEEKV